MVNSGLFKKFILVAFCICMVIVPAYAEPQYPKLTKYVNDFAGVLSQQEINSLNAKCAMIERNTTSEVFIVTVSDTGGQDVIAYAAKLGEINGVGKKETDNGINIVLSLNNQAGCAIATGRGTESTITDIKAGRIARDAEPALNEGRYYDGLYIIVSEIHNEFAGGQPASAIVNPVRTKSLVQTQAGSDIGILIGSVVAVMAVLRFKRT